MSVQTQQTHTYTYTHWHLWSRNLWLHRRKHIEAESLTKAPLSLPTNQNIALLWPMTLWVFQACLCLTCLLTSQDLSGDQGLWNAVDTGEASSADTRSTHTRTHTYTKIIHSPLFLIHMCQMSHKGWNSVEQCCMDGHVLYTCSHISYENIFGR